MMPHWNPQRTPQDGIGRFARVGARGISAVVVDQHGVLRQPYGPGSASDDRASRRATRATPCAARPGPSLRMRSARDRSPGATQRPARRRDRAARVHEAAEGKLTLVAGGFPPTKEWPVLARCDPEQGEPGGPIAAASNSGAVRAHAAQICFP